MKIYIAGKISDLPEKVYRKHFESAKDLIDLCGHDPISPVDLPHNHDKRWASYMMEDLAALIKCDAIYMLNNYQESLGASIERTFAIRMKKMILYEPDIYSTDEIKILALKHQIRQ